MNNQLTFIDLFAGCGGLSKGFEDAGFKGVGFVENMDSAIETHKSNFPWSKLLGKDITQISDSTIEDMKKNIGDIDCIIGGPPCQGFSLMGKRNSHDARNSLFLDFLRFTKILKPKCIMLENVRHLLTMKTKDGEKVPDEIIRKFHEIGYNIDFKTLNAKNFGVPQSRERVFFIGYRNDLNKSIVFPKQTHGDPNQQSLITEHLKPHVTFGDATKDLEFLESGEKSNIDPMHVAVNHPERCIKWLKNVPEGQSAHKNEDPNLRPSSGYNTTYQRMTWDKPSATIGTVFNQISSHHTVHPKATRSITTREALRCQTFSDDFVWKGTMTLIRKQIGNAVPPLLAKKLAEEIFKNLKE